jgi:Gas vesicle protein
VTRRRTRTRATSLEFIDQADSSLLDVIDNVLTKGLVVTGDVMLGLADVDLVYLHLSAVLCAADRILGARPRRPRDARRRATRGPAAPRPRPTRRRP